MQFKNPFGLNRTLSILLQPDGASDEMPYAARISVQHLSNYVLGAAAVFGALFLGTLLFLRELEINRDLQQHVLRLESEKRLRIAYPLPARELAGPSTTAATPSPVPALAKSVPVEAAPTLAITPAPTAEAPADHAQLTEVRSECAGETCQVKLSLLNKHSVPAEGSLLAVLEMEVPRIGGSEPSMPVRTRYQIFPGGQTRDELNPNELAGLEHRAFRITRALQATATFKVGKLLRPLAVNVYIFDSQGTLLQHERRAIEDEVTE
ncbi:hypothetical protein K2X33_03560 [bacterium]|nr:hypothetical protein [bacterium]